MSFIPKVTTGWERFNLCVGYTCGVMASHYGWTNPPWVAIGIFWLVTFLIHFLSKVYHHSS